MHPNETYDGGFDPRDVQYQSAPNAAISVAVMVAFAAIALTVMKKSGFRAMVAVGRA